MSEAEGVFYDLKGGRKDLEFLLSHPFPNYDNSKITENICKQLDGEPTQARFFPQPNKKRLKIILHRRNPDRTCASWQFGLKENEKGYLSIFELNEDYEWKKVGKVKPS